MPVSSKEFLGIQETIECGFILKQIHDMITYRGYIYPSNINTNPMMQNWDLGYAEKFLIGQIM